jgi:hypothetical protein
VQIMAFGGAGYDGYYNAGVNTDASGRYTFEKVPAGLVHLSARDPNTSTSVGRASAVLQGGTASVDVHVATAVFSTSTGFKSPRASRTWKFSGLFQQPGKPIYGHFRHNGKTFANYRFGVPKGPCGTLKRKAPGIPARRVPAGLWKVQVDFNRAYDPKATPRLTGSTTVITTFR